MRFPLNMPSPMPKWRLDRWLEEVARIHTQKETPAHVDTIASEGK